MHSGICTGCNEPFESPRKRKYCSDQCRQDYHNKVGTERRRTPWAYRREGDYTGFRVPLKVVSCRRCGKEFQQTTSHNQRYCSWECRKPPPKPKVTKVCLGCGKEFQTVRDSRCCSKKCNTRVWTRENPEAAKAKTRRWENANRDQHRFRQAERTQRRRNLVQGSVTTWDWKRALRRSRGRCFYCGERSSKLTVEHIIPLSRGGRHSIGNIVPACPTCNYQKQNRTVMEWRIWKQRRENAGTST